MKSYCEEFYYPVDTNCFFNEFNFQPIIRLQSICRNITTNENTKHSLCTFLFLVSYVYPLP